MFIIQICDILYVFIYDLMYAFNVFPGGYVGDTVFVTFNITVKYLNDKLRTNTVYKMS